MKVNFDNMRMRMVKAFNDAVINFNLGEYNWLEDNLNELKEHVGALCCVYDTNADSFSDLSEEVELLEARLK